MRKLLLVASFALAAAGLSGCVTDTLGAPPQLPAQVNTTSRTAIDFALNSFDAALSGLDFAMDAHILTPGSAKAKQIAAVGRKVMGFLNAASAARDAGNSASYEAAFANANSALQQFRSLLGKPGTTGLVEPSRSRADRAAVLARAAA